MSSSNPAKCLNISVIGVSGPEAIKGPVGVGKSLFCNRFVRPSADAFHIEHCSVLSQTDFGGSPVINNEHWLYWGDRLLTSDDNSQVLVRIVEQTEFLDDESYEPIASGSEDYCARCCRVSLKSKDKLMYIQKEQLGIEADFPQQILSEGKFNVDGFVLCCDVSRNIPSHFNQLNRIVNNLVKTKKPVVIALTKCDEIDEEAKRNVISMIMSRKDVKNIHMPPIEVSSVHDVNIEDVFHSISNLCYRNYKHRRKPLSYYEAAHYIEQRNIQMRNAYTNLLAHLMPMNSFPIHRIGWKHLLADLDRHHDFTNFVQVYGSRAAFRMYEKYMAEAREYWISARLRGLLPQLPRVLRIVFEKIDISQLEWPIARDMVKSHALFDEYFQPIGTLGRQLEPLTPDSHHHPHEQDSRLPSEILLLPEAKQAYEVFREEVREMRLKERLEEDFECLLSEMPEVTPGKTLEDASLFLQGLPAFENLQLIRASEVYDKFQRQLVHRAEVDFVECLLEYSELLVAVVHTSTSTAANEAISIDDLDVIKDHLEQDKRYRCMGKIFDLRDHLIYSMTSFYRLPSTSKCPAGSRCVDAQIANCLDRFFHRRNDHAYTHLIDIVVHGENPLVTQFITELSCFLRNEPFPCSSGSAFIRCFSDDEIDRRSPIFTDVFLIDSLQTLESLKDRKPSNPSIPSIFVVVCDPSNYDLIPVLHQQGASLAAKIGASFFGARGDNAYPTDDMASTNIASDCSSLLGRDQLMSICESICSSQLTLRKRDLRVQVSLMCADQYSIDSLISNTFGDFEQISYFRPIVHPNLTAGGVVPIDINDQDGSKTRVELAFCSYHSWFSPGNAYKINSTQAHVFVYYTKRIASYSHARTAICRLLDRKDLDFITPKSIFLIAIADGDVKNDPLIIEGVELCQSIGARFLAIHGGGGQKLTEEFVDFFADIQRMIRVNGKKEVEKKQRKSVLVTDEDGYASLVEHSRPTSLNLSFLTTTAAASWAGSNKNMNMPFQNIMARQDIDKKKKSTNSTTTRPSALKMRESRISRSGPVLLPQYRKSQPDIQIAPLATPEAIEIAPEYSLVKDAIHCDDDGIYETLDFESGSEKSTKINNGKNMNHLDLPGSSTMNMININNNVQDSSRRLCREPLANTTNGRRYRTTCVSSSPDPTARLHRTSNLHLSQMVPEVKILSPTLKSSTAPINSTIRQSLSAESLAEIMKQEKKSKNDKSSGSSRFVRKVATSFRFRKDKIEEKREEGRKSEEKIGVTASVEQIAAFREKMASRSLPQSPHLDRKTKLYTSLNNTSEKVSSAFSWLPSRSPKRAHKDKSSTCELNSSISSSNSTTSSVAQGVIASEETLETLCSSTPSGIPFYVEKCVEFIENNGGFEQEGLYRVPGNQAHLADVERKFLQTGEFDVSSVDIPVHVAATALKNFFSCLPSPAIPVQFHNDIKEATVISDEQEQIAKLHEIFNQLPNANRNVLKYLTSHLTKVSLSSKTVMDLKNLSKVWFPTLFRPAFDSYEALSSGMAAYQLAMELIFINSDRIL